MSAGGERGARADYVRFSRVTLRWADNDVYGHANNVVYYAWFDTAINEVLIGEGGLDVRATAGAIGVCVESGCRYAASVSYPGAVDVGIRVAKLGNTSVRYELGVFEAARGDARAVAEGFFVHVFVDATTRRPTPIPEGIRRALAPLARSIPDRTA